MNKNTITPPKQSLKLINTLSVVIPLVVAILLGMRTKVPLGDWTKALPQLNAIINSLTAVCLLAGGWFIRRGEVEKHRKAMTLAFGLGSLFLVFYVLYHISNTSTTFGGEGAIRYFYYFILISHILLSLVVLPFVLRAMYFALTQQFDRHRKVVAYAYPIWLYVSVTGVIAYLMIAPYYSH